MKDFLQKIFYKTVLESVQEQLHLWELKSPEVGDSERIPSEELPVTFVGVKGLIAGFIAVNSLHEVLHGLC